MDELLKTNDPVLISYATALLDDAGIAHMVLDQHMSIVEGSIGVLPKRVLVDSDSLAQARRLFSDAGLAHELVPEKKRGGA